MDYYKILNTLEDKLTETLNENGLVFSLNTSKYPITLTVSQNASPAMQMEFFSAEGSVSSNDAMLKFIFRLDGLEIRVDNRFIISDAFMNKVKGQAKKIHHAFLEAYFAERSALDERSCICDSNNVEQPLYTAPDAAEPDAFADFFGDDHKPVTDLNQVPAIGE